MARSGAIRAWNALLFILLLPVRLLDFLLHATQLGVLEVLQVRKDANRPEFIHLWYSRTLTATHAGARANADARMYGHVVIDTLTWKCTAGERQRGVALHLDSPFAERSIAAVGRRLGYSAALGGRANDMANCWVNVAKGKPNEGDALPEGPALLVHTWEFDGGADSVSGDVNDIRFVQGGKIRWRRKGQSIWMGKERCFSGPDGTSWMLYSGADLRLRAWRLADGEVLADRYVIGGIL